MARNMALPKIGVNMTEAFIAKWLVKPGDKINRGDPVMEVETDKAIQEIPATESGIVGKLLFGEGDTVQCHEDIIVLLNENETYEESNNRINVKPIQIISQRVEPEVALTQLQQPRQPSKRRVRISPLAKKIAATHQIDVEQLSPANPGDRITKSDVLRFLEERSDGSIRVADSVMQAIPMTSIRKTIAVKLTESNLQKPSAALTTTIDATNIMKLREIYKQRGVSLSIDVILAKFAGFALTSHPIMNSFLEEDTILIGKDVNIGIAVDTPKGLMVPVLHNVDGATLTELNARFTELVLAAKESRISPSDLIGSTFTITNLGAFGVEQFTPVINPPECCILAMGAIKNEFVPDENNQPVLQKRCHLTLVFDHRIVDGAPAAKFLKDIKEIAENPILLM